MSAVGEVTFLEILQYELKNNEYLREIYEKLLVEYTKKNLNEATSIDEISVEDALRFADLLIKADESSEYRLKFIGQEILILLNNLYENNTQIQYQFSILLGMLGNFKGVESISGQNFMPKAFLDRVTFDYIKEKLKIPGGSGFFFPEQKKVYDHLSEKTFSYSGPTSMGKSFVIQCYIKEAIKNNSFINYALIVPTKALISEVKEKLIREYGDLLKDNNYCVVSSPNDSMLEKDKRYIFLMTPERFLYLLLEYNPKLGFVFVDEAHKMSSNNSRATYYYKLMSILKDRYPDASIIFASPNTPNPEVYLESISIKKCSDRNAKKYSLAAKYSPVSQFKYLISTNERKIKCFDSMREQLVTVYNDKEYLSDIYTILKKIGNQKANIVYCKSKTEVLDKAQNYASMLESQTNEKLLILQKEIKRHIHDDSALANMVTKGIGYHVGYLPLKVRQLIENAFKKGLLHTIFCTSTLIEGINLPADNLFITSLKNGRRKLDPICFKNLIGRVGRISYGLSGNIFFILEKENYTKEEQTYLKLLTEKPALQILSIKRPEFKQVADAIVANLIEGKITLPVLQNKENSKNYDEFRKLSQAFIGDVKNNRESVVTKAFTESCPEKIMEIKQHLMSLYAGEEDISFSKDQVDSAMKHINQLSTPSYPHLTDDYMGDFERIKKMLTEISIVFKWDIYESHLINKNDGSIRGLEWYAMILYHWMRGKGVPYIITKCLEYKYKNRSKGIWISGRKIADIYEATPYHKSLVIADVLITIQDIVLFTFTNYFRKYSKLLKKQGCKTLEDCDWYEFIEYGTSNPLVIRLQKFGFNRETARLLLDKYSQYVYKEGKDIYIKKDILCEIRATNEEKELYIELELINLNAPEIFK